ncbi:Uncharacterised protein [Raoultella ornithinolytica]|nr:Uncharacterised protein [Raoultella ornithinolytica]
MMVSNPLFTASMHLVEQWLGLLTDLGRADATIKAYRGALTHYLRYCEATSLNPPSARFEDFFRISTSPAPWNGTAGRQCHFAVAHFGHPALVRVSLLPGSL